MAKVIRTRYASKSIGPYVVQVDKYPEHIRIEISREGLIRSWTNISERGFESSYPEDIEVTLEDLAFQAKIMGAARQYVESLGMV